MAKLPSNKQCALAGTHYCELLGIHSCDQCTIDGGRDSAEQIMDDLDIYEQVLPKGGIARLFQTEQCELCKTKPKGVRQGFAILYMAHPEIKHLQRKLFKFNEGYGCIIPVQLAICSDCRRTFLLMQYSPVIGMCITGVISLVLMLIRDIRFALAGIAQWVPFLIWITATLLGFIVGKIIAVLEEKQANEKMYVHVCEHPALREMMKKGWVPVGTSPLKPDVIFSKSRKTRGLGTWVPGGTD